MHKKVCQAITILFICFTLTGCFLYRPNIQQGNIITEKECAKLRTGLSRTQVENIIGTPVLKNIFSENTVNYVYTFKPGHGKKEAKQIIVHFKNNKVVKIEKNCT